MNHQDVSGDTVSYPIISPEDVGAESNSSYQKPPVWDVVKNKWRQLIHQEVSRYDTQIDEHSGLIETIEQNLKKILHDDIERQRTEQEQRLKSIDTNRQMELERLKQRLAEVIEQKEELGGWLEDHEKERRTKL